MRTRLNLQRSTYYAILFLLAISFVPLIAANRHSPFLNDDTFITLTFAKNLAYGNGFVFNHPPAVLGTTTPLLALTVAGLALILPNIDIPVIAVFLTAFCWLGIIWTFFFYRKEWGLENWHVCILALAVTGTGWISFLGMEAYPYAFLLVLTTSLFLSKHYRSAGFAAGLLFLTRGEGVLVLFVLIITAIVTYWIDERSIDYALIRRVMILNAFFAIPILLWLIFAESTFGSFLPSTLTTKQAYVQSGYWKPFPQRLIEEWIPRWGRTLRLELVPFINFWWVLVFGGLIDVLLRRHVWLILIGWITLFVAGYSLLNVSAFWWYQLPVLFVLNLLFALGFIRIIELVVNRTRSRTLAIGISILLTVVIFLVVSRPTVKAIQNYSGDSRGESYTALSQWFRENAEPTESIAYIEIGYLGFFTDNRIVDLAGLIIPESAPHIADGDFAWSFWEYEPDYYVHLPDFDWALGGIRADSRFDQEYKPVDTLPGPRNGDFIIFKRINS